MGLGVSKAFGIESAGRLIRTYLNNVCNIFNNNAQFFYIAPQYKKK